VNTFFHRLSRILWGGIVILMVSLAIYVSVGRLLTANVAGYRTEILRELNARVPFTVEAQQVSAEWKSFTPVIVLTGLRLSVPGSSDPPLELSEGRIGIDGLNSLRTLSLQMTRVELTDLSLHGELSRDGALSLTGFDGGGGETAEQLREFLLHIELVALRNNRLILTVPGGEVRDLGLDLLLSRDGSQRKVEATLTSTRGAHIVVVAEGVGDPFRPELFSGRVYADIQATDLGAIKDLLVDQSTPVWADGAIDLQLWLAWDKGNPSVEARIEGRDLLVVGQNSSWQVPLDHVALQARLVQHRNRWTLFVADLHLENGEVSVTLPRIQLDTWDKALRLRASDIPLEPINALIADQKVVPDSLREVFAALHPRGRLSSLQLSIGDTDQPTIDWEVEANFEAVAVDSFKGAPGITSATGYTQISPDGGFVLLDSQMLTLAFPAIYPEPLHFEELHGTVHLDWDADSFNLASGLLTTQGEEGEAKVLFGVSIPRVPNEIGIEMNLLVGLGSTHPTHRVKYIPSVLNASLRTWLDDSIGEGVIEQGAFLWRGSLRKNSAPLHTIQLAFNVADTQLSYHPQWPPVQVEEGIVLIDDSEVSVWADRASLLESKVEGLSVETRLNAQGQITLALDGRILGPAADGLKVLNESPLSGIVGPAFVDWTVNGELETDLALRLNLSDKSIAPWVDVTTRWRDVDLMVMPGNLPVNAVNGEFDYSTTHGFSSRALVGELWGKTVSARLEQHHRTGGKVYDPATSVLDVELATEVDMADVRRWLQLELLAFVSGQTAADIGIRFSPGESPVLSVDSDLQGVSLDLPQPWKKGGDESRQLHLEMTLAQGGIPLSLDLGEELKFRLDIADGAVHSGALGINVEPPPVQEDVLRVTGHASLIQGDEWLGFVTKYFSEGESASLVERDKAAMSSAEVVSGEVADNGSDGLANGLQALSLEVVVDAVQADTLVIQAQELENVVLSLDLKRDLLRASLETDWLRGALSLARDGGPSHLAIEYLDLDRLPDFKLSDEGSGSGRDLQVVDITLNNLFQSEQRLGELSFELHGQDDVLTARKITGELAGLRLGAERPGRLVWHRGQDGNTELQASIDFEDLGRTLGYFGYEEIVETERGDFEIDLRWPGAPQEFSLREGQGSMQVKIGSGSFLEVTSGAAGALRVVSILNLADIVRRLSLSHMFESGIPFESVDGEIFFHAGTLEVARMDVKGSSSFQFSGVSDVESQSLSGELVATLPVARNLPWIAALAASLPVAAGVFVVSKVFSKQMNRLSSAVYSISGSWNEPQVNFDHIFDNSTQGATGAASIGAGKSGDAIPGSAAEGEDRPAAVDISVPAQSVSP
jgi:uncharacterized protein (TIGR02099 family)